jgi:hypothetical protein
MISTLSNTLFLSPPLPYLLQQHLFLCFFLRTITSSVAFQRDRNYLLSTWSPSGVPRRMTIQNLLARKMENPATASLRTNPLASLKQMSERVYFHLQAVKVI